MNSSEAATKWVTRWRCQMAPTPTRRGVWRLKGGGFLVRARVTDPRTGREYQIARTLRGPVVTLREALRVQMELRDEGRDRSADRTRSRLLWSEYTASLFEAKVAEGKLTSAASRERWANALSRLVPAFGEMHVDDLRHADVVAWRDRVARWIREGMPSSRKRDIGTGKTVKLSPITANGWISILKTICSAMKKDFDLDRNPAARIEYFPRPRTYTREQPNALTARQVPIFLAKIAELHPNHYAMVFLGVVTGARPSTLRPLRRSGPECDVLWEEGCLLLRRSNSRRAEIMERTKTALDQEIPLPLAAQEVLKKHVASLPEGPMRDSVYLFPSRKGGMRTRSVLDKPFAEALKALHWNLRFTPRGLRRTFQDLARHAEVHDVVTRAISGHQTERMHHHYSTAQREEMRLAVGKVVSLATG
jgi:Phage integrase family